jgi:hypothetical protein
MGGILQAQIAGHFRNLRCQPSSSGTAKRAGDEYDVDGDECDSRRFPRFVNRCPIRPWAIARR